MISIFSSIQPKHHFPWEKSAHVLEAREEEEISHWWCWWCSERGGLTKPKKKGSTSQNTACVAIFKCHDLCSYRNQKWILPWRRAANFVWEPSEPPFIVETSKRWLESSVMRVKLMQFVSHSEGRTHRHWLRVRSGWEREFVFMRKQNLMSSSH